MAVERFALSVDGVAAADACLAARMPTGDPGSVRLAARRSAACADELRRLGTSLRTAAQSALWQGAAREAFVAQLSGSAPRLTATGDRYDGYGRALRRYADALDTALVQLPPLRAELERGRTAYENRPLAPVLAGPRASGALLVGGAQHVPGVDTGAERALWQAAVRFKYSWDQWADALDECTASLLAVNQADPTRDLHGWHAAVRGLDRLARYTSPLVYLAMHPSLKTLSDELGIVSNELTVVGLGLLMICPPAAGAALGAAATMSAMQLGVDTTRRVRGGADGRSVSDSTLGFDALGAAPIGRPLRALKPAAEAIDGAVRAEREIAAAERAFPGGSLQAHGRSGGHTISRHVGLSDAQLRARFAEDPTLQVASTLTDLATAEHAIARCVASKAGVIDRWLAGTAPQIVLHWRSPQPLGRQLIRNHATPLEAYVVRVVLRRNKSRLGFFIVTSYLVGR